jgi:predicted metalloprotease
MRWKDERRSENVEDRRRISPAGVAIGGGVGTLLLVAVALFLGAEPRDVLKLVQQREQGAAQHGNRPADPAEEERKDFVSAVLAQTEDVWHDLFRKMNREYREPHLVLFTRRVDSACGLASAAVGPFYCPAEEKVYIDLGFYQDLKDRFRAPGEFAEAYVIAHEIGHHVQNLLGISSDV